jgi:TolA-binding protein
MKLIIAFLSIIALAGCASKKSDKELFDEAQKYLAENKVSEAIISLEEISKEHSDSELAPEALSQLASIYQNKQDISISEKENLEKAVALFKRVYSDYPKSEYAPSSLFMAGFIYANDLQNYKEAEALYKQFLNEYPDNELAPSAQAELENLGLTPEEILQRNLAKEQ